MDEEKFEFKHSIGILILVGFMFLLSWTFFGRDCPKLDDPNSPFIVYKIKESWMDETYCKYYSRNNGEYTKRPKPIILKNNFYDIGDTIMILNR